MKNIIYGLGQHFWANLEFLSGILKDTIALCDSDKTKLEPWASLNLPLISPQQIKSAILGANEDVYVYISTIDFYDEVFDMLTGEVNISPKNIGPLPVPDKSSELLTVKNNYRRNYIIEKRVGGERVPLKADALDSAILLPDRADALKYMPKNGIVAEVGVAYGDFSRKIIDALSPKKFYAIDIFNPSFSLWDRDDCARSNMTHQQWYENRFKAEIECGMLETRQGLSWDCLAQFPNDYFDYVYLDAAHDYHSVKKDIDALKSKIKHHGFIQFNDYCTGPELSLPFGVIKAVNSFVNSGRHKIKYFCLNRELLHVGTPDIVVQIHKSNSTGTKIDTLKG